MCEVKIRFGTDGWRGVMARDFTFDGVRRLALALALHLEELGAAGRGVAVGFDRRLLSDKFAAEVAGVLAARKIPVHLSEHYIPTPVLAWAVSHLGLAMGVMVTASHNPPEWNGMKIKEHFGGPSQDATNRRLEELAARTANQGASIPVMDLAEGVEKSLVTPLSTFVGYRKKLCDLIDFDKVANAGGVGFDAMHGCGANWTDNLMQECGLKVRSLRTVFNPGFCGRGPEPLEERLKLLKDAVLGENLALGVANDGDADRISAVDEHGEFFSPQSVLAVLTQYLVETKGLKGAIVKTVSSTSMLDLIAEAHGLEVIETPIGFKHTSKLMVEREVLIGGDESGAIGIGSHLPERDGIANALLLTEIVGHTGAGLKAYLDRIQQATGPLVYTRRDVRLKPEELERARQTLANLEPPPQLCGIPVNNVSHLDGIKFNRSDRSWLLLRLSGTEPLLRVYAEARSAAEVAELVAEGLRLSGQ